MGHEKDVSDLLPLIPPGHVDSALAEDAITRPSQLLDAVLAAGVRRFVYTSTYATIGLRDDGPSTEADACNWLEQAPAEVEMRPLLPIKTKQHGVVPQMVAREPGWRVLIPLLLFQIHVLVILV